MSLHFLRPEWFLALIVILLLALLIRKRRLSSHDWARVVDAALLPHLVSDQAKTSQRWWYWWGLLMSLLVVIALAGPVWKKLPQPVFKQQSALVIALDLSQSMNAQDIKPSRLARARLKLIDILKMRKEGQTALLAYAATPYTVSPLTDDSDTIQSLVSSLTTDIMPAQGSRSDLAIQHAQELLQNAGLNHGDILLITDGINDKSANAIRQLDLKHFRVSILAVGTAQGAPIPEQGGGFIKDSSGSIVVAKTDLQPMRKLASELGGIFLKMKLDDGDISRLKALLDSDARATENRQTDFKSDRWQEEGPWLLLLVLPLAALAFRRGLLVSVFVAAILLPALQPVHADDSWNWKQLFLNQDQQAAQALQQGNSKQAAELFKDQDWKAAAHYKAGEYEKALQQLQSEQTPDALYNRANSLAKLGRLQQALETYDDVLKQDPNNEDASYNRKLVEQALKQQQQQQQQQQKDQSNKDQSQQDKSKQDQSQQGQSQQGQSQQGQQKDQQQQSADSKQQSAQNQQDQQSQQDSSQPNPGEKGQSANDQQKDQQQSAQQGDQNDKQKADAKEQQQAQKQADEALEKNKQDQQASNKSAMSEADQQQSLSEQAQAQWLRRIPDDPGGLLRNKFKYQYGRQRQPNVEQEQW